MSRIGTAVESRLMFCEQCGLYWRHDLLERGPLDLTIAGIYYHCTTEMWKCGRCGILKVETKDTQLMNASETIVSRGKDER
jgi:uncharacterized Zn finger protein